MECVVTSKQTGPNPGTAMVQAGSGLFVLILLRAIPHNSKCRYGERGAADTKPKAQIVLDAAKVSAVSGGNSEPKQGQRSQSARGSTMRVPQPDIIEHFGNAVAVPQPPERCLSRQAGIVRYCLKQKHPRMHEPMCIRGCFISDFNGYSYLKASIGSSLAALLAG